MRLSTLLFFLFTLFFATGQNSNLIHFTKKECDQSVSIERIRERISNIQLKNDSLFIQLAFIANCAYTDWHYADAVFNNDTLHLTYGYPEKIVSDISENGDTIIYYNLSLDECNCYFECEYVLAGITSIKFPITFNNRLIIYSKEKYKTYPIRYQILRGDTINLIDKHGFKQGKWLFQTNDSVTFINRTYQNDTIVVGADYKYHHNGEIKSITNWENDNYKSYKEYNIDGQLIKNQLSPFE